jgi:hypothetical protein
MPIVVVLLPSHALPNHAEANQASPGPAKPRPDRTAPNLAGPYRTVPGLTGHHPAMTVPLADLPKAARGCKRIHRSPDAPLG